MARPKKLTHFRIRSFKNRSKTTSWRVTGTKPDGTRVRQNYADKAEAIQAVADLEMEVAGVPEHRRALRTTLSPEQLADAEAAFHHLNGTPLAAIVAHFQSLDRRAAAKGVTVDNAFAFFEAHYRPEIKAISLLNAVAEFHGSRIGIEETTRKNYEGSLKLLLKLGPNKNLHDVQLSDLEKVLAPFTKVSTRRTHRRIISIFFNWCLRRRYCLEDPCKRLDKLPKEGTKIGVLSFEEVKRLLKAAISYKNGIAAAPIAIALFAGLRPSELEDLGKENVTATRIRVTGGKLRRTLKRSVPIPAVLADWLKSYPFEGVPDGWDYKLKVLKNATKAKRWVSDVIRHTSITFQAERDKDEALTAFNCGTSKGMMDQHYRNMIDDPSMIDQFWSLTPSAILADVRVRVALPDERDTKWPSKTSLEALVWSKPMVHAAKELGVSDVALRKRCVRLGIELPPKGHWIRQESRAVA